mmetsp:Transcript_10747/g.13436  ORF Transcript_10747/g.13436 Transcript_10747/m.13436 type:complete len:347 (-) Transcript_10747:122-1162(-)
MNLSTDDRLHLCNKIVKLNGAVLNDILKIIREVEPTALRSVNEQWVFDLGTMRDGTLLRIRSFLESKFGKRYMQQKRKATGLMSQLSSATLDAILSSSYDIPGLVDAMASQGSSTDLRKDTENKRYKAEPMVLPYPNPTSSASQNDPSAKNKVVVLLPDSKKNSIYKSKSSPKKAPAPRQAVKKRTKEELHAMGFKESFKLGGFQIYVGKDDSGSAKRLICGECGKMFRGRSEVVVHVRVHTGDKPLSCNYCGKTFAHPSNLKVHERGHRGEKPYVCTYPGCDRRFAHSMSLKDHSYKHTGAYPHQCTYPGCTKGFRSKAYLGKHLKSHAKKAAKLAAMQAKKAKK